VCHLPASGGSGGEGAGVGRGVGVGRGLGVGVGRGVGEGFGAGVGAAVAVSVGRGEVAGPPGLLADVVEGVAAVPAEVDAGLALVDEDTPGDAPAPDGTADTVAVAGGPVGPAVPAAEGVAGPPEAPAPGSDPPGSPAAAAAVAPGSAGEPTGCATIRPPTSTAPSTSPKAARTVTATRHRRPPGPRGRDDVGGGAAGVIDLNLQRGGGARTAAHGAGRRLSCQPTPEGRSAAPSGPGSMLPGGDHLPVRLDDLVGDLLRHVLVVVQRGAERAAAAGDRTQLRRIREQL